VWLELRPGTSAVAPRLVADTQDHPGLFCSMYRNSMDTLLKIKKKNLKGSFFVVIDKANVAF